MTDAKTDGAEKPMRLRNFRRKMRERRALRAKWKQRAPSESNAKATS